MPFAGRLRLESTQASAAAKRASVTSTLALELEDWPSRKKGWVTASWEH